MAVLLCVWANRAAADLYRWVDPETGSVKLSTYPPPWFNDAAAQRRAPKVEVIPPGRPAASSETPPPDAKEPSRPAAEPGVKPQAPAASAQEERRKLLLRQIAALGANLAAAKPEEGARIHAELADLVREFNAAALYLTQVDPGGEAARRAEWNDAVSGIAARRTRMLEQLSAIRVPADGSSPDSVRGAWLGLGRQLALCELMDNALKLLDPGGAQPRQMELALLTGKIMLQWKPALDAVALRPPQ